MIEELLPEISAIGYRLVSLSDTSVSGQPRWWATLQRASADGQGLDIKFGEAATAYDALFAAFVATPRFNRLKDEGGPKVEALAVESTEDGEGLDF
jgi:hypothetical protein